MDSTEQENYARVALLSQKIHLNVQALLQVLSRNISSGLSLEGNLKERMGKSIEELGESLSEFEEITSIGLLEAQETLVMASGSLDAAELKGLYDALQKLYRDDYLEKIMDLAA